MKKEYIEITLPIIVNIFGNETEFESLFCTDRPTPFECINRFNAAVSEDTWILRTSVDVNFRFHDGPMFAVRFFLVENRFSQGTSQDVSQDVWKAQTAYRSTEKYECDDYIFEFENVYIFAFVTKVSEKTTIELEDELEENCTTVYVRTINERQSVSNATKSRKEPLYRRKLKEDHRSREA